MVKPDSVVRKVILTGLPAIADNSLITALIHGGAIESFLLTKSSESGPTSTAIVTFTNGNAAEAYYDKYPNGLAFKLGMKKYVVYVDKGKDVDVVSGLMRGYLESGASRVVCVSGADEDWSMRALEKIAESKGRKVETIIDTFRDGVRSIVFRFTNIPDAVAFKATMLRDIDWEDADIRFAIDPCEKATGVHFD